MGDRTDQVTKTRDEAATDVDLDALDDDEWWRGSREESASGSTTASAPADPGGLSAYFSPRVFLLSLLVGTAGAFAGGMVVPFLGNLVGLFVAAFGTGLVSSRGRYAEMGLAGGVVASLGAFFDYFALALLSGGAIPLLAGAGVLGGVVALLGVYFGRDLRSGLTADL